MHHRWRERAADLARVGPGDRALDVATGTGDLAIELARRAAREVVGLDFSERDARARAARRRRTLALRGGQRAGRCPTRTTRSTPRRSASGRATSPTSTAGCAEMARVVRPGGRVVVLEITTPQRPPLSLVLPALVRPRRAAARPRSPATPTPTPTCRAPCGASRTARSWAAQLAARRAAPTCAGSSPRAGSSPSTSGRARERPRHRRSSARCSPRAARSWRGCSSAPRSGSREIAGGPRRRRSARHAGGTLAAGGKRLRPVLVFLCGGATPTATTWCAAGVAVELLHMATLVHDDVLDRAPLRRGRPTVFADGGPRRRHGHRRPPLLARVRRAGRDRQRRRRARALGRLLGARARRADAARRRLVDGRDRASATSSAAAEDGAACSRRPAGWARCSATPGERRADALGALRRRGSAWRSRSSTTCSTSPGPPERTGKPRGTDLLDGTVTLPLILARERDPELSGARPARCAEEAEAVCDRIAATGALDEARERGARRTSPRRSGALRRPRPAGPARRARSACGGRRGRAVRLARVARSPREDRAGVERARRSGRSRPPCSRASGACSRGPARRRRGRAPRRSSSTVSWVKTPSRQHVAVRAVEQDAPVLRRRPPPTRRGRRARSRTRGRRAGPAAARPADAGRLGLGQRALVGEVDDLDRLAARERHTLREMPLSPCASISSILCHLYRKRGAQLEKKFDGLSGYLVETPITQLPWA